MHFAIACPKNKYSCCPLVLPAAFAARAINFPILTIRVKMSHRLRDFDAIDIVARFMRELQHKPNVNTQRERPKPSQTEPSARHSPSSKPRPITCPRLSTQPLPPCARTNVSSQQLEKRQQQRRQQQQQQLQLQVDCGAHNDS